MGNQPLKESGMAFDELGLSAEALSAVKELGYTKPTPVQERTIPAVLAGHDVMVATQTGTGKTAAYLLPVLDCLESHVRAHAPRALIMVPTRELALQVSEVASVVGTHTGHKTATVVGGVGYEGQRRALRQGCDVLVATPGRLLDLIEHGNCDVDGVKVLVLDETDRMLDMGFLSDVQRIVSQIPTKRQTLLFSATLTSDAMQDMLVFVRDPVCVDVTPRASTADAVLQYMLPVAAEAKKRVLVEVLRREGARRVIVFVSGRHRADHLCRILQHKGFSCDVIQGGRSQGQRMRALKRFVSGEVDVLVATDVLARGIDVEDVSYVINVDVPHESENYVHRIGRTGRAGRRGWSLTLCSEEERRDLRAIERFIGSRIAVYPRADGMDCGQYSRGGEAKREAKKRSHGKHASGRRGRL